MTQADCQSFIADPSLAHPDDIFCTEVEIFNLLNAMETTKASGPDKISGKMLKGTATSLTPNLTELFNLSIRTGKIPQMWKIPSVVPIPKTPKNADNPCTIGPYVFSQWSVSYWKGTSIA